MPYFKWQGVDLYGRTRHGLLFARSPEHLDLILLKRDIALMRSRETKPFFSLPINLSLKVHFFRRLATLLNAGVLLPQALSVLSESMEHGRLQEVINDLSNRIKSGESLHQALAHHSSLFDPVVVHMSAVGQEAGALPLSLQIISNYLETKQTFYKKIRSAVLLPALSFLFFISIALIIFIGIMPLFSSIFESMQYEIPTTTQWLMKVSSFLRSSRALILGVTGAVFLCLGYRIMGRKRRKKIVDRMALHLAGIRTIVVFANAFSFFQSVSILLKGGIQLVPALRISKKAVNNSLIQTYCDELEKAVAEGSSLGEAVSHYAGPFSRPDIETMITVGQESGTLADMLAAIAHDYQERLDRLLAIYSTLVQPVLMIILGVLVALLIVAVYMPILNFSYAIS